MTTPNLENAIVHLHSGGELECKWYLSDTGPVVYQVKVGHAWTDPARDFMPDTIEAWRLELYEMLAAEAEEEQFKREHEGAL